jgi:hypothetical protein
MPTSQPHPVATRSILIIVAALVALAAISVIVIMQLKRPFSGPGAPGPTLPALDPGEKVSTKTMSGIVKTVGSGSVTFSVIAVPGENGLVYEQTERTATVTQETEIILLTERSSTEMQRLLKAYMEAMKTADPLKMPNPPEPFTQSTITLNGIKVGDQILVQSVDDADIGSSSEFDVSLIKIHRIQ